MSTSPIPWRRRLRSAGDDPVTAWHRPLQRLLEISGSHLALVVQRRSDGHGVVRIGAVPASGRDLARLQFAALELVGGAGRWTNAIDPGGRIAVFWLDGPHGGLALVVARRPDAPAFDRRDLDAVAASASWAEDVALLWWENRRAAARVAGLRAGFGLRGTGAVLLDGRGAVIEVNDSARALLARNAGLVAAGDRLTASAPDDAARLDSAIAAVIVAAQGGQRIAPRQLSLGCGGAGALHVAVMRPYDGAAARASVDDPAVLLLVVDPHAAASPTDSVCALYALSPAQGRLAGRLAAGDTLAEAAAALGLTLATARTYLKQVFARTGTCRQSGLVRMLLMGQVPARGARSYVAVPLRRGTALMAAAAVPELRGDGQLRLEF